MNAIWKFPLLVTRHQVIMIPGPWEALSVQVQEEHICLWACVTPGGVERGHEIMMVGTGMNFDAEGYEPLGTVIVGPFVWHYWMKRK